MATLQKEITKFFAARLTTLGLEMIIMFIFVTVLKLNSDIWSKVQQDIYVPDTTVGA